MSKTILGKKIGMTQIFAQDGTVVPVTVIETKPCVIVQKKTQEIDGYSAIQVGFGDIREKLVTKPLAGHFKKANTPAKRFLREVRVENVDEYEVGQAISADIFEGGEQVDVSGISKGHGFQGSIRRWNQHRGPMTHGSHYHRGPGALSACAYPGKVFKGRNMPGHMGAERVTIQNLSVVRVDTERDLILIKGSVPGARGSLLTIKQAVKSSK